MNYNNNELIFGSYLAGLWEGDGYVAIKDKRSPKPTWHITFNISSSPLAEKLLECIKKKSNDSKAGSVHKRKDNNSCVLNIYSVSGLTTVVNLINGHLRSPKAYQLERIIAWLNLNHGKGLTPLPKSSLGLSDDAWLAGFIDADGNFTVDLRLKPRLKLSCVFQLNQRLIDPSSGESYDSTLKPIVDFLGAKQLLKFKEKSSNRVYFLIKTSNANSKAILRIYLQRYVLLSSKHCDFKTWCAVDDFIVQKNYGQYIDKILSLKNTMNKSRKHYNWRHLKMHL